MMAGPLVEEPWNLRTEEQKPPGFCFWVQEGFLFPAVSKGAAGRRGAGFTLTATEGAGEVCLEMLRKFTAHGWRQDSASPAVLQQCRHFAGSCGHSHLAKSPLCWGCHFSTLPPVLWTRWCLSIDCGVHRFSGDRVVARGVSCVLYALNAACLGGLGALQDCISWGLPPPAAWHCWDQHLKAPNASEPAQIWASRHASPLLPSTDRTAKSSSTSQHSRKGSVSISCPASGQAQQHRRGAEEAEELLLATLTQAPQCR